MVTSSIAGLPIPQPLSSTILTSPTIPVEPQSTVMAAVPCPLAIVPPVTVHV